MKWIIAIVVALGTAVGIGMFAMEDPGYVVLSREPYTVRMPLVLLIGMLLALFTLLYLLINFLVGLVRTPGKIRQWNLGRRERGAQQLAMKGFSNLIEGDWSVAEGNLLSSLDHNRASLMSYLGAAYAAQQQGLIERRNAHIDAALKAHPRQEIAIRLTRARMQMQTGDWEGARMELESLRSRAPRNVVVSRLLADTYRRLGHWSALVALLPALRKLNAYPAEELRSCEAQALNGHLQAVALRTEDGSGLKAAYRALPKRLRQDTPALASYAQQLIRNGHDKHAESLLRKALYRGWQGELARLYAKLETANISSQINLLRHWGQGHEDDVDLKLALAILYRRDNELAQARDLLEQVATDTGDPEVVQTLGEILEQMGEPENALVTYRQGLKGRVETVSAQSAPDAGMVPVHHRQRAHKEHSIIPLASDR